jgi:hypothetical protein
VGESLVLRGDEEVRDRLQPIRLASVSSSDGLLSSLESQYLYCNDDVVSAWRCLAI